MHITEKIVRLGSFWLPKYPNKRLPGTLKISDGGKIDLEILGHFDVFNSDVPLKRIFGEIENEEYVTLENCSYFNSNTSGTIIKSSICAEKAFLRVHYDDEEDLLFHQFRFSAEGLNEWLDTTGISVHTDLTEVAYRIDFIPPEQKSVRLENNILLSFGFSRISTIFSQLLKEAQIRQNAYVTLTSEIPLPINDFIVLSSKIIEFLSFAIDKPTSIREVFVSSNDIVMKISEKEILPIPVKLFYQSHPFSENPPKVSQISMLFTFPRIQKNAELIINKWIESYESIDSALALYFLYKSGNQKYLAGKFLSLIQGLETYHRRTSNETLMSKNDYNDLTEMLINNCPDKHKKWLRTRLTYGNEISLRKRLKILIEPFKNLYGSSSTRKNLIGKVVDTRNYLTHYDKALENKSARGLELWKLCIKMEIVFQLHLLKKIGFTNKEIISIVKQSIIIHRKLSET